MTTHHLAPHIHHELLYDHPEHGWTYEYGYHVPHAPWMEHQYTRHHEVPAHLHRWREAHQAGHEPHDVTDGTVTHRIENRIRSVRIHTRADGSYVAQVHLVWFRDGIQVHAETYITDPLDEAFTHHHRTHRDALHRMHAVSLR